REEGSVTFNLDQVEVGSRIDHFFEQPRGVHLGVGEAHPMRAHVLRIAADISDQEDGTLRLHARRCYWASWGAPIICSRTVRRGSYVPQRKPVGCGSGLSGDRSRS